MRRERGGSPDGSRRGRREADRLGPRVHGDALLHLGCGEVVGVAGLVGVDDTRADPGEVNVVPLVPDTEQVPAAVDGSTVKTTGLPEGSPGRGERGGGPDRSRRGRREADRLGTRVHRDALLHLGCGEIVGVPGWLASMTTGADRGEAHDATDEGTAGGRGVEGDGNRQSRSRARGRRVGGPTHRAGARRARGERHGLCERFVASTQVSASALPLASSPPKRTSWLAAVSSVITSSLRASGRTDGVCAVQVPEAKVHSSPKVFRLLSSATEEDEVPAGRVVGHRGEGPSARRARRGDLGPGRAGVGPGVPEGVRVHVESTEEDDRIRRRVEGHRRVGSRRRGLRDPGGAARGPGVTRECSRSGRDRRRGRAGWWPSRRRCSVSLLAEGQRDRRLRDPGRLPV